MGRKKKEESTLDNIVAKADEYRCSLCGFVARKVNDCDHHILVEHQGQVRYMKVEFIFYFFSRTHILGINQ